MSAGNGRKALLGVAAQLSAELGYVEGDEIPGVDSDLGGEDGATMGVLSSEDELLVARVRRELAKIAAALSSGDDCSENSVGAALDGIEMMMRGELVVGNAGQLPALMPGFVFLVILPVVDQDEALEISQRAAELIEHWGDAT